MKITRNSSNWAPGICVPKLCPRCKSPIWVEIHDGNGVSLRMDFKSKEEYEKFLNHLRLPSEHVIGEGFDWLHIDRAAEPPPPSSEGELV